MFFVLTSIVSSCEASLGGLSAEMGLLGSTVEISNAVNRWFRRSASGSENEFWGMIILAIGLLWVVLYYWDRARKPRKPASQDRESLFNQLCDLHKLSKNDRLFLKGVAKTQRLDVPALAFVNPRILLEFAKTSPHAASDVQTLVDRLFGESLVEEIVSQTGDLDKR